MTTQVDLAKTGTEAITRGLNTYLADSHIIYGHLHALHWNYEGPEFFQVHRELQRMYEELAEFIDDTAERILMLGNRPATTFKEYLETSSLDELPSRKYEAAETAKLVLADLEHQVNTTRELIKVSQEHGDEGTADFAIAMLRAYEKQRWFWSAFSN